jgi:hypothetical protein
MGCTKHRLLDGLEISVPLDLRFSPSSTSTFLILPPPLGDPISVFTNTTRSPNLSSPNLCRRHGTSLASSYSSSLKSSIPLPFFLCGEYLAFVTFPFHFTFISAIKPFGIAGFPFLLRILPPAVGIYFLSIVVQALLLRNPLSFL